jgi:peptidoglycan glycosyltransferase
MLRRHFIPALLAAAAARAQERLAPFLAGAHGTALLVNAPTRRLLAVHAPELAGRMVAPPGSTVKPFAIAALIESGKLRPAEEFRCPGALEIGGRNLSCSHPPDLPPMQARSAIAYSCNCFVAHYAARFEPGELTRAFGRYGLLSRTGWVPQEASGEFTHGDVRLQALGESGVLVTPAALAMAYTRLAAAGARAWMAPVMGGLQDAVEFGTAQRARIAAVKVAGKTGSVRAQDGAHLAWFAGFAPGVRPKYLVAVMLQGLSGGADAAPVAGRILEAAWRANW